METINKSVLSAQTEEFLGNSIGSAIKMLLQKLPHAHNEALAKYSEEMRYDTYGMFNFLMDAVNALPTEKASKEAEKLVFRDAKLRRRIYNHAEYFLGL